MQMDSGAGICPVLPLPGCQRRAPNLGGRHSQAGPSQYDSRSFKITGWHFQVWGPRFPWSLPIEFLSKATPVDDAAACGKAVHLCEEAPLYTSSASGVAFTSCC